MIKLGQTRKENLTSTFLARITEQATLWSSFQRLHFTKPSASLFDLNHFELHCTNMFPLRLYKKFEVLCKISVFKRKRKLIIALLSQRFFFFRFLLNSHGSNISLWRSQSFSDTAHFWNTMFCSRWTLQSNAEISASGHAETVWLTPQVTEVVGGLIIESYIFMNFVHCSRNFRI